jgi:hypothetical protein
MYFGGQGNNSGRVEKYIDSSCAANGMPRTQNDSADR